MSTAVQNRNLLDQLTASAAPSPTPPMFAPATGDGSAPPGTLTPASDSATSDLESLATSPEQMASRIAATQQTEKDQHPGFLDKLKEFASGASGEPGLSGPDSTPRSKGAAIASILGRVGNGLALAAGTPEQKSLAVEQEQIPLKLGQMQNEALYRRGMLGLKDQANQNAATKTGLQYGTGANGTPEGTSRITAEAAQQNADSNEGLRAAHQKQIEASLNGEVLVMPEIAKAIGRPELAGKNMSPIQYQQQVSNVLKSLGMKTVDLGDNGVWGASPLTGRTTRLGDSPSVARSDSMLRRTQLPVNDNQGNVIGWVNPQTKTFTAVSDINGAAPGAPSLSAAEGGGPIPPKPTSSMLTQGQMAQTIQAQIPVLKQEITALGDKIGATGGRWNDFWVKKAGANDPAYAGVDQDLQLYATAIGKAHFGASMPEGFVKDMMRDFGMAQSPEDLQARIDHAEGWINGYAARIGGGMPSKTPNAVNPSPSGGNTPNSGPSASSGKQVSLKAAMSLPANQGKSEADVRADIQAHGHKVGP